MGYGIHFTVKDCIDDLIVCVIVDHLIGEAVDLSVLLQLLHSGGQAGVGSYSHAIPLGKIF